MCHPSPKNKIQRMAQKISIKLFVEIDDFMKKFEKELKKRLIEDGSIKRGVLEIPCQSDKIKSKKIKGLNNGREDKYRFQ